MAAALALVVPLLLTAGSLASPAVGHAVPASGTPPSGSPGGISYSFTWNGKGVTNSTTTASALGVSLSSPIAMQFHWTGPGPQGPPGGVSEVEFQAYLFGFPFIARALTNSPALTSSTGVTNLTWDPGGLNYLISGTYQCLASIFSSNGTTIWSEWFYVNIHAPYTIGAVLPIILLLLVLFEVYALLTVKPTPPKGGAARPPPKEFQSSEESTAGPKGSTPSAPGAGEGGSASA
ncbi:MAG TPA: hypothetical protein VGU43_07045 [Thermoplasmata archaeon]|nr:hypothetical protein [Thermoplasmata archaeon]